MPVKITRRLSGVKTGLARNIAVKVGYPEETTGSDVYDNGFTLAHNAAVQTMGNPGNRLPNGKLAPIPPRDFMGQGAADWRTDWIKKNAGRAFVQSFSGSRPELFGEAIGLSLQGFIREAFTSGNWPGNSEYTIARKGSSRPLIDDGILRRGVDYLVEVS